MYNPKISTIQPIYCDFFYNSVSNNNWLFFINIKDLLLIEQLNEIENITYYKVTQSYTGVVNKVRFGKFT